MSGIDTATAATTRTGAVGSRRSGGRRPARTDAAVGLAFVAPAVVGVIGLGLVPFGFVIWFALHDWNPLIGEFTWTGLDNFTRLAGDDVVWGSLLTTLAFTGLLMVLNISLALFLAILLNQRLRGITTFRAFFFSPVVVSTVAWVLIWGYLVADNGGINGALSTVGIDGPNWLRDATWALVTVVVIQVFKGVGMNMILFLAALQGVPPELKEAARIDGAGAWRTFRSVTIPLITPTILLVSIVTMIAAMDVFVPIQVLTSGGPGRSTTVISYLLYQTAFRQNDFGYAAAIGVLLFVVTLALTLVQWQSRRRWVHDEV
ncbi:carbohydrate ABC transporter permease [Jiangella endophytica]|uniref:carbohydrate ABC transporter permease n=1 Tax=Jiangella endophytica TaxID=1623398 RepID=UPI000E344787|nr:sugar ABC transporter permease [Jiangella endophytica]